MFRQEVNGRSSTRKVDAQERAWLTRFRRLLRVVSDLIISMLTIIAEGFG